MTCSRSVPVGIKGPNGIRIRVRRQETDDAWNPQDVSAATIEAIDPDGIAYSWPATFSGATTSLVVVDHVWSGYTIPRPLGDIDKRGTWRVWASCTIPGGTKLSVPGILTATEAGEIVPDC